MMKKIIQTAVLITPLIVAANVANAVQAQCVGSPSKRVYFQVDSDNLLKAGQKWRDQCKYEANKGGDSNYIFDTPKK